MSIADKYKDFSKLERAARSVRVTIINNTPFKLFQKTCDVSYGQVSNFKLNLRQSLIKNQVVCETRRSN
jgi:hypothetical protein